MSDEERSDEAVDIDFLVSRLSVQDFRAARGGLYSALAELRSLRGVVQAVESEWREKIAKEIEAERDLRYPSDMMLGWVNSRRYWTDAANHVRHSLAASADAPQPATARKDVEAWGHKYGHHWKCADCDAVRDDRPKPKDVPDHPQVSALMPIQVDAVLAPLLRELWRLGADTDWSCQGDPDNDGYISFRHGWGSPTASDIARLLGVHALHYVFEENDYDPPPHIYLTEQRQGDGSGSMLRFPFDRVAELTCRARALDAGPSPAVLPETPEERR